MPCIVRHIATSILLAAALLAQEPDAPTFGATTKLVQVSFNVARGKYFAADLQASDFVLLEDGHPREFTVFEGPHTAHPLPLELVLLFDTSKLPLKNPHGMIGHSWDAKADYDFLDNWDESIIRMLLEQNGMDVRLAVYHFDDGHFERLCGATRDPREIADAFRKLLNPIPAGANALTLLPGDHIHRGNIIGSTGWWKEAAVATLKDAAASPVAARRVMFLFSDLGGGGGPDGVPWEAVGDEANVLGIAVDPVDMNLRSLGYVSPPADAIAVETPDHSTRYLPPPWNHLGDMTGGELFWPVVPLNRDTLADILQDVRDTTLSKYVVGFVPEATAEPGKHKLKVELKSKSAGKMVGGEREGVVY